MNKAIYLFLIIILFTGCTSTQTVNNFNRNSQDHSVKMDEAFKNLASSIANFNSKNFDQAITDSTNCAKTFEEAKALSVEGKTYSQQMKLDWLSQYKDMLIGVEDLRINQCKSLEEAATESKAMYPDEEKIAKDINFIADTNTEIGQKQVAIKDIESQHADFFK